MVAPHNLTFNKRAIKASETNHQSVVATLTSILSKHQAKEDKKNKGLSAEMVAAQKKQSKPIEVVRTETLLNSVNANFLGQ